MLKNTTFFIIGLLFLTLLFAQNDVFLWVNTHGKKINKQIKKAFEVSENVQLNSLSRKSSNIGIDLFSITDKKQHTVGYGTVLATNSCKLGGCTMPSKEELNGIFEEFTFLTLYDTTFHIKKVKILEYGSNYGYAITAANWLKQFIGQKAGDLKVGKDIDGISGATISVNVLIKKINEQQAIIENSIHTFQAKKD